MRSTTQGLADLSLVARRRAPIAVVGIFAAFTLAVTLLISPLQALQPANPGNIWAPLGAVVASYAPVYLAAAAPSPPSRRSPCWRSSRRGPGSHQRRSSSSARCVSCSAPWSPSMS